MIWKLTSANYHESRYTIYGLGLSFSNSSYSHFVLGQIEKAIDGIFLDLT